MSARRVHFVVTVISTNFASDHNTEDEPLAAASVQHSGVNSNTSWFILSADFTVGGVYCELIVRSTQDFSFHETLIWLEEIKQHTQD